MFTTPLLFSSAASAFLNGVGVRGISCFTVAWGVLADLVRSGVVTFCFPIGVTASLVIGLHNGVDVNVLCTCAHGLLKNYKNTNRLNPVCHGVKRRPNKIQDTSL